MKMPAPVMPSTSTASVGDVVAVVAQEQLLQRRRLAGQRADAEPPERVDGRAEVVGVDLEQHPLALDDQVVHAGQSVETGGRGSHLGRDGRAGEVAQVGQRAGLDRRARTG